MSLSLAPLAGFALLHAGAPVAWTSFTIHPSTVLGIAGLVALYEESARRRTRFRESGMEGADAPAGSPLPVPRLPSAAQRFCFYTALGVLFLSLNGWLHDLSDYYLFSAHMVQHLLLALVVAPLLIMGTPGWMLRPALSWPGVRPAARWLTRPMRSFAIFNVVVAAWHLPVLYNTAMAHHPVHIAQHLMFLTASVIMWWPILSPLPELPRLAYPLQMLYLFLMSIPMSIVAVYIALAGSVLYPAYESAPRIWAISPLQDQMVGGLIMWIPGGLYFFAVISVIFFRWQQRDGVESSAGAQVDWTGARDPLFGAGRAP
ncbi:MAG TPA: cytochrome c oxidase assembly protein [Gemmatimonadaceae bacterium]|nr:cytochrome c oxidase assembly protein [Gemmatimonadaceae bacterium]